MSTSAWRGSADAEERLVGLASVAPRAGVFTDFDGSLSPIVSDPESARAVRGAGRVLNKLAKQYKLVAVISGRPVRYLAKRLHTRGVRMVGLYGVEERVGRSLRVLPEVRAARDNVERAALRLRASLEHIPGIYIEHKGLAVSVHFRRTQDPETTMDSARPVIAEIAAAENLAPATRGKLVLEIGATTATDKGEVVRRLIDTHGLIGGIAIGDDAGDIPMFDALEGLDYAVRVVVGTQETPDALLARADILVASPQELVGLLKVLASASGR